MTTPNLRGAILADVVLLNRIVYDGTDDLVPRFRADRDPSHDPPDAGIRPALNVYDRYDPALAPHGLTTLGAAELGFGGTASSTADDLLPGDGNGIDRSWFYAGDLFSNRVVRTPGQPAIVYPDAAAVALAAVRTEGADRTLHLAFRGTDADLGKDGEAGTAAGQVRYHGQLQPLIDAAYAFAVNVANGIDRVVVSGIRWRARWRTSSRSTTVRGSRR